MHRTLARGLASALLFALSISAPAADSTEELVITTTRFPERRLDAPIGTRVITSREIEASTAQTLPEVLGKLGGVHVRNNSGSPDLQVDLRGFGITGDQNTLVLLDGVRLNPVDLSTSKLSSIPLAAIERIEILPGGGAVQYGAGAVGGTLNIITKAPRPGAREAELLAGVGSYATSDLRAGASLAGERAGLSLYGNAYDSDNYRRNNEVRTRNLAGDLRYALEGGNIGLKFGADTQQLRLPGARTETELTTDRRGTRTPDDFSKRDGAFTTLSGLYRSGEVELAGDAGFRQNSSEAAFASLASYLQLRDHQATLSPRLRFHTAPFGLASQVVAGFDWLEVDWRRRIAGDATALNAPFSQTALTQRSSAGYVHYLAQLSQDLRLNLGYRAQRIANTLKNEVPAPASEQKQTRTLTAVEAALRYAISPAVSVFGKYGTAFRVATVDENGFTLSGELLEPQTSKAGEVGAEYRSGAWMVRANAYLMRLRNEIYFSPLAAPFGVNVNLSPTERRGIELATSWAPLPSFDAAGSLTLQRARFREGIYGGVDVAGKDVPLVPELLASLRATWELMPRTRLSASYNYVGRQRYDNDQANTFPRRMPAYELVDLRLAYSPGNWTFAAIIANLFDQKYYSYAIVNTFACPTFCAYPQAGRTFFASAQYAFK